MTVIDFGQLMKDAGEGFQPVPSGPYNVQVAKAEAVTSSTGKPMIKVQLRIMGGPHDGRLIFDQFVITAGNPNALAFFFEHMAAFGLDRSWFAQNPPLETVASTLVGRSVMISVGVREFKGADRNEVQSYKPAGAAPTAPQAPPPPQAAVAPPVSTAPPPAPAPTPVPQPPVAPPVAAPVPPAPAQAPVPQTPMAPVAAPPPAPVAPPTVVPPPAAIAPQAPVAPPQPVPAPAPVAAVPAPVPAPAPEPAAPAVPQQAAPAPVPPVAYSTADEEPF